MFNEGEEGQVLPFTEDLVSYAHAKLIENTILQNKIRMMRKAQQEIWLVGLKEKLLAKAK
jgi:hypothetical protein